MGNSIENTFESDPVDDNGVANIPHISFVGGNSAVVQITIKTDHLYSKKDVRKAEFTIRVTAETTEDILLYKGFNLFAADAPFADKNIKGDTAKAAGDFRDRCDCVPPIDNWPCKKPQVPFDLVDKNGKPQPLTASGFAVSGTLRGTNEKFPKDAVITGSLILICD